MGFDAIVVPFGAEARAVRRGWHDSSARTVGVPAGSAAGAALCALHAESAIVFGLCGALSPALRVGDAVVYQTIGGDAGLLDPTYARALSAALNAPLVRAATADRVVTGIAEKRALGAAGYDVVDMEAASIARACAARGIRCAMVRVVSDAAASALPDLSGAFDAGGRLRPAALAFALVRTPLRSARFIGAVRRALDALTRAASAASRAPLD